MSSNSGQFQKGQAPPRGVGRPPGALNKRTREFRDIVQDLIDKNQENVALWLEAVAMGRPPEYNAEGVLIRPRVDPDPAKALDLLTKLSEFAAPKLARTEVTGAGGTPLIPPAANVTIESKPPEES